MLAFLLAAVLIAEPAGGHDPQKLIAILKSDAPAAEKAVTCKRLAIYGNKDAVPVLAPLLADEKLASWARIALEAIPDPAADDALREAVGTLKGKLLIGVINTIGVRRDAKASNVLTAKLKDADADVAAAAAVALGRIGGPVAAATLMPLLGSLRPAAAEGCILCAERLLADGDHAAAVKLYDAVRTANVSKQKTLEATRGAILARQADGVPLLLEQLRSQDRAFFNIALRTVREMPGSAVGHVLSAELEQAKADRQPYLLLALADRGGPEVLPAALKAAQAGSFELRLAAVKVLGKLADLACLPVLVKMVVEDDAGLAQAAKSELVHLPGEPVDAAVAGLLNQTSANARRTGIELVAVRRVHSALPALLQAAVDPNPALATASLKALGDLAGEAEIPAMLGVLLKTQATDAAETALASLCSRLGRPVTGNVVIQKAAYGDLPDGPAADVTAKVAGMIKTGALSVDASNRNFGDPAGGCVKRLCVQYIVNGQPVTRTVNENETVRFALNVVPPAVADALCAVLPQATGAAKLALLRVLRSAGGPKALAALRASATDPNAEVKETALRALCDWDTAEVLPDMVQFARTTTDKKWKILALRAQLRLIPLQEATTAEKLAALKEAMALIERTEEKRLALAALAEIPSAGSLALVVPFLGAGGLKEEAGIAAVAISEKIVGKYPSEVAGALKQVSTNNKKLAGRVRQLQAQTKGK